MASTTFSIDFATVKAYAPNFTFTATSSGGSSSDDTCTISIHAVYNTYKNKYPISNIGLTTLCCELWCDGQLVKSISIGKNGEKPISGVNSLDLGTYSITVKRGTGGAARSVGVGAYVNLSGIYWSGTNLGSKNVDTTVESTSYTIQHTCYFNGNGGTASATSGTKTYGQQLYFPTATRSGFNFLGWSENSQATSATYAGNTSYWVEDRSYTFYAVWETADIAWSMSTGSIESTYNLVWSTAKNFPILNFDDANQDVGINFKVTTSGTISNFKYSINGGSSSSKTVSAGNSYTVLCGTTVRELLNNQYDKSKVNVSFTGSFTLSNGSSSFNKTFSRVVTFNIATAVTNTKAELIYCYKTSATAATLKYKLYLPMAANSYFTNGKTYDRIRLAYTQNTKGQVPKRIIDCTDYTATEGSNEVIVTAPLTLDTDDVDYFTLNENDLYINTRSLDKDILKVNLKPYAEQDILMSDSTTAEKNNKLEYGIHATEFIETSERDIMFQKGGRVWCNEFEETCTELFSNSYTKSATTSGLTFTIDNSTKILTIKGKPSLSSGNTISCVLDTFTINSSNIQYFKNLSNTLSISSITAVDLRLKFSNGSIYTDYSLKSNDIMQNKTDSGTILTTCQLIATYTTTSSLSINLSYDAVDVKVLQADDEEDFKSIQYTNSGGIKIPLLNEVD